MPPQQVGQPYPPHGGPQQQAWGQPSPQQGWPQQPVPQTMWWKSPAVLVGAAVVLVGVLVVGVVAISGGGDSEAGVAAAATTTSQEPSADSTPTTSTVERTTTTSKAVTQSVSPDAQAVIDVMPDALRQVVVANKITEKAPVGKDPYTVQLLCTVPAKNSLTVGLLRKIDIDRYPIAWIDTDPAKRLRQWSSQHPEWLIDKGEKKVRVDDTIPGGGATVETFNTSTNLYVLMSGFKDKESALTFVERAGL
ncbi:hypothetical protein [Nocardia sp. SSK8]|uniref:hypothetical protein n=1 Tax=Nocardia sp. SSK8 TaxID=3120154 RepID=UPI003009E899